jgi:hypothetical protein
LIEVYDFGLVDRGGLVAPVLPCLGGTFAGACCADWLRSAGPEASLLAVCWAYSGTVIPCSVARATTSCAVGKCSALCCLDDLPDSFVLPKPLKPSASIRRVSFPGRGAMSRPMPNPTSNPLLKLPMLKVLPSFNPQQFVGNCCKAYPLRDRLLPEYNREYDFATPCSFSEKAA